MVLRKNKRAGGRKNYVEIWEVLSLRGTAQCMVI